MSRPNQRPDMARDELVTYPCGLYCAASAAYRRALDGGAPGELLAPLLFLAQVEAQIGAPAEMPGVLAALRTPGEWPELARALEVAAVGRPS
jgi:hypothetical protein